MFRQSVLTCVLMAAVSGCGGQPAGQTLADRAISGTPEQQEKAALELSGRGKDALPLLRKVAKDSTSPRARATAIQALGAYNDAESMPLLLASMEDPDSFVRGRAGVAVANIIGADYHFKADDPLPKRKALVAHLHKVHEKMLKLQEMKK